jgi:hypothetical protein
MAGLREHGSVSQIAGELPDLEAGYLMYSVLGGATALKAVCYAMCVALQSRSGEYVPIG